MGTRLIEALQSTQTFISADCGGKCRCGKCIVTVNGEVSPVSSQEARFITPEMAARGLRLACACIVYGNCTVEIGSVKPKIAIEGIQSQVEFDPPAKRSIITADKPTMKDTKADLNRVFDIIDLKTASLSAANTLPKLMRENDRFAAISFFDRLIAVRPENLPAYAAAVDIGTTTIAAYLIDLKSGKTVLSASDINPQKKYGADVISRANYTIEHEDGLDVQTSTIRECVNSLIEGMLTRIDANSDDLFNITIVGNTIMMHIFANMPVEYIASIPFVPVYTDMIDEPAVAYDMPFKKAIVTIGGCVAGYVGADTVAASLACDIDRTAKRALMLDIGTNGELVLKTESGIYCCAAAAGPAFEGAHIKYGSGAVPGAIDSVSISGNEVTVTTIGNRPAASICGSGVVSAVSELLKNEIIDETGYLEDDFELSNGVFITPKDIREVQLAKSAIAAGISILLNEAGIGPEDVEDVFLAGGFGNYIDKDAACNIGLIPSQMRDKIRSVGNAAGSGAKMYALSINARERAEALRTSMKYIELSARSDFQELFAEYMLFEQE